MQLGCNYMHCFAFYIGKHTAAPSYHIRRGTRGAKGVHGKAARARMCCCSAAHTMPASGGSISHHTYGCQRNTVPTFLHPKGLREKLKIQSSYGFLSWPSLSGKLWNSAVPLQWCPKLGSLISILPADAHGTTAPRDPHRPGSPGLSCRQQTARHKGHWKLPVLKWQKCIGVPLILALNSTCRA